MGLPVAALAGMVMVAMPAGAPLNGSTPAARVALVTPEMPPIVSVPVGGAAGTVYGRPVGVVMPLLVNDA